MEQQNNGKSYLGAALHGLGVLSGAAFFTFSFFMVLPMIQAITEGAQPDYLVRPADVANPEPEEDLPEEEPPQEEEEEQEEDLELEQEAPMPDLDQLSLALNPNATGGFGGGGIDMKLDNIMGGDGGKAAMFALNDLDSKPRPLRRVSPIVTPGMRAAGDGKVFVLFMVSTEGRVEKPRIQTSTDPIFNEACLRAIRKWTFEPGTKNGKPVSTRTRQLFRFKG